MYNMSSRSCGLEIEKCIVTVSSFVISELSEGREMQEDGVS